MINLPITITLTLLSFPRADIRSAHSLVYSKFFNALSTAETYLCIQMTPLT